ncbi:MAG: hypothetical protein ACI9K2_003898 [Myxococcota bacterium]|jgi:hypothetical protein
MRSPLALAWLVGCLATADPAPNPGIEGSTPAAATLEGRAFIPVENTGGTLAITVDATDTASGWLTITERLTGFHLDSPIFFKEMGRSPEHEFADVRAFTLEGQEVPLRHDGGRHILRGFTGDAVELRYKAKPGGIGRHGHQGLLREDWASFDGRVYMLPKGAMGLSEITVQFKLPDGWAAHTPFRDAGDGVFSLDTVPDRVMFESLQTSCVALGSFDHDDRTYGDTDFRVAAYGGFTPEHKALLFDKTHRMATWFHDKVGFNPSIPFMFAFLPMPDDDRIFGGAWATGACYEQPDDRARNWELLGHRFAHPINKYNPTGMTLRDGRDHWFMEGWASYIEIVSTSESGIADADQRAWNRMYMWYTRERALHPKYDMALAKEKDARGDGAEVLHYSKGPLVVKLLDEEMRRTTDTSMEPFFKHLYGKYGGHRAPVPLRDELEAFTGRSFDGFWARHVDRASAVVPIWGAFERSRPAAESMMQEPPMAMVGTRKLHPSLVHYLTYSAQFERLEEIERWLERAVERRAELDRRGIRPWPEWMYELEYGLHPAAQWHMMEAELAWPLELEPAAAAPAPASAGCGGGQSDVPGAPVEARFSIIDAHPSAVIWRRLREAEDAYVGNLMHTGLEAIQAHRPFEQGEPPVGRPLGFGPKQDFVAMSVWLVPPDKTELELVVDGKVVMERRVVLAEPGWHRTWLTMSADKRPEGEKIVVVRVYADGELAGERAFWQRALPADVE